MLNDFENKKILDLFGGSGALTIESISRGAVYGVVIEKNKTNSLIIKENINKLKIENIKIIVADAFSYLKSCTEQFDIIFIDPPYELNVYKDILEIIHQKNILNSGGYIVCEMDSKNTLNNIENFEIHTDRKYGNTRIIIFTKE